MKHPKQTFVPRAVRQAAGCLALAIAALSLTGCGPESSENDLAPALASPASAPVVPIGPVTPAVMAPPPAAGNPLAASATAAGAASPFSQPDQGANDRAMASLNEGLRKFYAHYQRAPYTTDELVAEKFVESMPAAPEGKEYFYDSVGLRFKLINKRPE